MSTRRIPHRPTPAGQPPDAATRRRALGHLAEVERPTEASTDEARDLSTALFERLRQLEEGTAEYSYVRNTLVELNLSLVKFVARRFRSRPEPREEIVQVGTIGLIKAISRFDPSRGTDFNAFAIPTVVGEMKRFFRDASWSVHVPRRLQELRLDLAKAQDELEQRTGHHPTRAELAERLDLTQADIVQAELATHAYTADSLDAPLTGEDDSGEDRDRTRATGRATALTEPAYELVDDLTSLQPLIARLDDRDREILSLRFSADLTQADIGRRVGLSQMHVSRILARILGDLRSGLLAQEADADAETP